MTEDSSAIKHLAKRGCEVDKAGRGRQPQCEPVVVS
jgi:hypothetical protein